MGRDWSWLPGGGKKKSSNKSKKDIKETPPSSSPAGDTATAAGCMSAVFNIFDLQHLQFPINHHHLHLPKGVDAPRNSLETTEDEEEETPSSLTRKDGNLSISMGIKIKTKPQATSSFVAATESYSPSVKTPTLVARLMGLDLFPDNYISSPTPTPSSHTNKHRHYSLQRNSVDGGTRSLPDTPRVSLGRRSVDVNSYQYQRSSLHLRDNINVKSEREHGVNNVRLVKEMKIHEDKENRSPRDYARQIVMQLKENVNRRRRMGTDITNKTKPIQTNNVAPKVLEKTVKVQDKTRLQRVQEQPHGTEQDKKQSNPAKKCNKAENFKSRLVKQPQTRKEELFVRSPNNKNGRLLIERDKSSIKTTSLSVNNLISFTSVPSVHTIKKKDSSKLRETQLSRNRASSKVAFEEEREEIVTELERSILEALVAETTTDCFDTWTRTAPFMRDDDVSGTWGVT